MDLIATATAIEETRHLVAEDQADAWEITSPADAAWALDKVLTARARRDRIKENFAAALAEAEREVADAEAAFVPRLEAWALANPPERGKTIRLPTGALRWRTVPGGPRVVDAAAALAWAERHLPSAVRVEKSVLATPLKEFALTVGELPDGVEAEPAREVFSVRDV
jgi:phage host-nuclease inhibitor protein Gam